MAIGDDFSVAVNGDIRHVSGTDRYTVLAFHRWLQNLADNPSSSNDDLLDITSSTPSARATDNIITLNSPYNIDDTAAKYLYNGSIEQAAGGTLYSGLVVVGSVYAGTTLQVVQNNALYDGDTPFWGQGINTDAAANILSRMLIKTRSGGSDIDGKRIRVYAREWGQSYAEFEVTMGLGNSVAAIFTSQDLNNQTAFATVAGMTTITNVEGYQLIDLNNGNSDRPYYAQWNRTANYTINQLYERAKYLSVRGTSETLYGLDGELFRGITHQILCDNPSGTPFNAVENITWSGGTGRLLARVKCDSGSTTIDVVASAGTYTRSSGSFLTDGFLPGMLVQFTGYSNSGNNALKTISTVTATVITVTSTSGLVDESGTGDERALTVLLWMQLLTGVQPTDNQQITGSASGATADVNVSVTARSLTGVFLGQSTGSAIIGGYGVGFNPLYLTKDDKIFDLTNTQQTPPNNVVFYVYGLASGEDRVLVTNAQGLGIDFDQMSLTTTLNGGSETAVVVNSIPADTPQTGNLRIQLDTGIYRLVPYTAHNGSTTFTIASTDFTDPNDATSGNNVFLGYIDKEATAATESVTLKYSADRTLFVRVRDGGASPIKTFETTAALGTGGGSATANRITDA